MRRLLLITVLCITANVTTVGAQRPPDAEGLMAAQREAMRALSRLDGIWVGSAWTMLPSGERHEITQTERVGSFLDGTVKVIEGRGYERDGSVAFNALGIVSYDPGSKSYSMRSYAMGRRGDYPLAITEDGFTWQIAAGAMTIRYVATFEDDTWREVGLRSVPGREPVQFFEMTLTRRGDTDWPAGNAVVPHDGKAAAASSTLRDVVVDASCGQCRLGLDGLGCDLAVRIDGVAYFVDGTGIDDHGDAHGEHGFCNAVRRARVSGHVEHGRFVATRFELLPPIMPP